MSKRPRIPGTLSPVQAQLARVLGPLDGAKIRGGCDHCDAYQVVRPIEAGWWDIGVYHDDDCPFLARIERGRAA